MHIKKEVKITLEVDSSDVAYLLDALELLAALINHKNGKIFENVQNALQNKYTPHVFDSIINEFRELLDFIEEFEGCVMKYERKNQTIIG